MAGRSLLNAMVPVAVFGLVGCGAPADGPVKPQPLPTAGQVTYQGRPLATATVSFLSEDGKIAASGETDVNGEFTLSTHHSGDGAPVGRYKVLVTIDAYAVSPQGFPVPKRRSGPAVTLPEKYGNIANTPLSAEVTQDGPNHFVFSLK
jgi:hypothetical protein